MPPIDLAAQDRLDEEEARKLLNGPQTKLDRVCIGTKFRPNLKDVTTRPQGDYVFVKIVGEEGRLVGWFRPVHDPNALLEGLKDGISLDTVNVHWYMAWMFKKFDTKTAKGKLFKAVIKEYCQSAFPVTYSSIKNLEVKQKVEIAIMRQALKIQAPDRIVDKPKEEDGDGEDYEEDNEANTYSEASESETEAPLRGTKRPRSTSLLTATEANLSDEEIDGHTPTSKLNLSNTDNLVTKGGPSKKQRTSDSSRLSAKDQKGSAAEAISLLSDDEDDGDANASGEGEEQANDRLNSALNALESLKLKNAMIKEACKQLMASDEEIISQQDDVIKQQGSKIKEQASNIERLEKELGVRRAVEITHQSNTTDMINKIVLITNGKTFTKSAFGQFTNVWFHEIEKCQLRDGKHYTHCKYVYPAEALEVDGVVLCEYLKPVLDRTFLVGYRPFMIDGKSYVEYEAWVAEENQRKGSRS